MKKITLHFDNLPECNSQANLLEHGKFKHTQIYNRESEMWEIIIPLENVIFIDLIKLIYI